MNTFSLSKALKDGWNLLRANTGFFVVLSLVTALLQYSHKRHPIVMALQLVAVLIWSILWKKISLAAAKGKQTQFAFSDVQQYFPTLKEILSVIVLSLIAGGILLIGIGTVYGSVLVAIFSAKLLPGLLVVGAVVLLIGLYIEFRLIFSLYVLLDQKKSISASLKASWHLTKHNLGKTVWTVAATGFINAVGSGVLRGVGLLITQTPTSYAVAKLYVTLSGTETVTEDIVIQPAEILPPNEEEVLA